MFAKLARQPPPNGWSENDRGECQANQILVKRTGILSKVKGDGNLEIPDLRISKISTWRSYKNPIHNYIMFEIVEDFMTFQSPFLQLLRFTIALWCNTQLPSRPSVSWQASDKLLLLIQSLFSWIRLKPNLRSPHGDVGQTSLNSTDPQLLKMKATQQIIKHPDFPWLISGCRVHSCSDWSTTVVLNKILPGSTSCISHPFKKLYSDAWVSCKHLAFSS